MKHLKYFESVTETQRLRIDSICYAYNIKDYTINSDGKVDVYGDVYLNGRDLKEIPLKFGYVSGNFYCGNNPNLPEEIKDNKKYINKIVKYQNDYNIWRRDGSLDKYRFSDMMKEILEEEASR